jgi:hypothetical protein
MKKTHLSLTVLAVLSLRFAAGQNLLSNPNFELGNIGFISSYLYSPGSDANQGDYAILHNPFPWNPGAYSMTDHTSGTGFMLVLNGSSVSTDTVWRETVSVQPNTTYSFSGWEASWGKTGGNTDPSPAVLLISINGLSLASTSPSATDGIWGQFGLQWNSGSATQASIDIRDLNTSFIGNDFALDDMSLAAIPEPSSTALVIGFAALWFMGKRRRV